MEDKITTNHGDDDEYFSNPENWVDINQGDDSEQLVVSEYDQVISILQDLYEAPGNDGHMMLAVMVDDVEISLGNYLANDLFKKESQGKITKQQRLEIFNQYIAILNDYKRPRVAKAAGRASMLTGAERRVGFDYRELAAGEHLQD